MEKKLYIIAGCNGAGKTTASLTILPEIWECDDQASLLQTKIPSQMQNDINIQNHMSESERKKYNEMLKQGLELAEYRMLRDKAMRNLTVIQGDGGTGYREVSARELFTTMYHEPVPTFQVGIALQIFKSGKIQQYGFYRFFVCGKEIFDPLLPVGRWEQ